MALVRRSFLGLVVLWLLSACVSVRVSTPEIKKSQRVSMSAPGPEYQEIFLKDLDYAWQNTKTGETISLFTECSPENQKSLSDIRRELLVTFTEAKVMEESRKSSNSFEMLRSLVKTREANTTSYTDLAIYKTEKCVYIASHVSVKPRQNEKSFGKFLQDLERQL